MTSKHTLHVPRIITEITPIRQYIPSFKPIHVCAYVRVSTSHDDQLMSLRSQTEYYQQRFSNLPNHILVDVFSDAGISGAKENRPGFQTMLLLQILDHIETHDDYLTVVFLAGIRIRVDICCANKLQPRWTHTRKAKSELARQRMALGLTQERLAALAGVARTYLNRVENGLAVPSLEFMQKLSRIIGPIDGYHEKSLV